MVRNKTITISILSSCCIAELSLTSLKKLRTFTVFSSIKFFRFLMSVPIISSPTLSVTRTRVLFLSFLVSSETCSRSRNMPFHTVAG